MSEIFLAFQRGLGGFRKIVVLKQILPDIKGEEEFVRMFLDEARITGMFTHPNIAQVFDLDIAEGELFLAMEFVAGATLVEVARACRQAGEPIPIGLTLLAVRDTALALHYAHTFTDPAGRSLVVIHRDIAEKNIMVTYGGVTKLLDFGIAKNPDWSGRTTIGMVKGTSGYMSPEQITGQKLDPRTDIFSLGVVLHECLTGMRLFPSKNNEDSLLAVLKEDAAPPSRQNPKVTPEIDQVVGRALQRNRDERYPTALELARDIEKSAGPLIWHPEQAGQLITRFFADRREQTQKLLENNTGERTAEVQLAELLKQREIILASPPPPAHASPAPIRRRASLPELRTDPSVPSVPAAPVKPEVLTAPARPAVRAKRSSSPDYGASEEPKTVLEVSPPSRKRPQVIELDTIPGRKMALFSETDPAIATGEVTGEATARRRPRRRALVPLTLGAMLALSVIGVALWLWAPRSWGTTAVASAKDETTAPPPEAPPPVKEKKEAVPTPTPPAPPPPIPVKLTSDRDNEEPPTPIGQVAFKRLPGKSDPALNPGAKRPPPAERKKHAPARDKLVASREDPPPTPDETWTEAEKLERERKQAKADTAFDGPKSTEPGTLSLVVAEGRVKVFFKSQELGDTPLENKPLPAGTHALRLLAPDGKSYKLVVDIPAGKPIKEQVNLINLPSE